MDDVEKAAVAMEGAPTATKARGTRGTEVEGFAAAAAATAAPVVREIRDTDCRNIVCVYV